MLDTRGIYRIAKDLSLAYPSVLRSIHTFFEFERYGTEAELLAARDLEELSALLSTRLLDPAQPWNALTVQTSGSTASPKLISHSREFVATEVASWRALLPAAKRVLSLVPSHHLYGLIWTVLWPASAGIPVLDARSWSPKEWSYQLRPGDVVVAVPIQWARLMPVPGAMPPDVTGISSAGSLSASLWERITEGGITRLIEVYGSTETGGVATRESATEPFRVAPHYAGIDNSELEQMLPDTITPTGDGGFYLAGRKDGAVKVAGNLVSLALVESALRDCDGVNDCRLRIGGRDEASILEALIVTHREPTELERALVDELKHRVPAACIPRKFVFAATLPLDAMGKATAW